MKFAIIVNLTEQDFAEREGPNGAAYMGAYMAYGAALSEAGVMRGGAGLQPPHATTALRLRDGVREVQDGPFADAKDQIGGMYLIETDSLDEALDWAAKCPAAGRASVEVRPLIPGGDDA